MSADLAERAAGLATTLRRHADDKAVTVDVGLDPSGPALVETRDTNADALAELAEIVARLAARLEPAHACALCEGAGRYGNLVCCECGGTGRAAERGKQRRDCA